MSDSELTTVGPDFAVIHHGPQVTRYDGLTPDTAQEIDGHAFRTLADLGPLLSRVATVNDVHFGETECGLMHGDATGPVLRREPGEAPYPEVMNRAAVTEITAIAPDAVIVKGDLTSSAAPAEFDAFHACYGPAFGERLHVVRGNHDAIGDAHVAETPTQLIEVPGAQIALLDTSIQDLPNGRLSDDQLDWLDAVGADADVPVLVMGHHHPWNPDSAERNANYFGITPDASDALVDVARRRPALRGYFAGHTHRNRRRTFQATGEMPWVEVASVKDFPGSWAEYRIHEGGILQLHHRISSPEALAWTEKTRAMFGGAYPWYSFGKLEDRCFVIPERR